MAGNRALYDRAIEQTREAARQKNWEEALKQAVRALQEFPSDGDARSSARTSGWMVGVYLIRRSYPFRLDSSSGVAPSAHNRSLRPAHAHPAAASQEYAGAP